MAEDEADKYRAPALDKGLDILEYLASSAVGLSQAEIAKGLGRGPNEIYRMLNTLMRRNYITRSPEGDRFMLSLKLLVLANIHPPRRRILDIAEPLMRQVAQDCEQSCHLALWENGEIVIASSFSAPGNWRLSLRPGAVIGIYNTGSGKILAAFQEPDMRKRMLAEHKLAKGEERVKSADFEKALEEIRKTGHSIEPSGTVRGAVNLTFPILDPSGNALAALACPFLERIDDYKAPGLDKVTEIFAAASKEIGRQINGGQ